MNFIIDCEYEDEVYRKDAKEENVIAWVSRVLENQGNENAELSISFVGEETMTDLNQTWRSKEGPTDILSFVQADSQEEGDFWPEGEDEGCNVLGDMVICLSQAQKNSEKFNVSYTEEIQRLLIHGCLHLLGHDHKTNDVKTEPMLALQETILLQLGGDLNWV